MRLPEPLRLMRRHVEALYTMDGRGRLIAANVPGGGPAPRLFLGRTVKGSEWWFREDVDARLAGELEAACHAEPGSEPLDPPYGATIYEEILSRHAPVTSVWTGPAFAFPDGLTNPEGIVAVTEANRDVLLPHLGSWLPDASLGIPLYATVLEEWAVAVCGSWAPNRSTARPGTTPRRGDWRTRWGCCGSGAICTSLEPQPRPLDIREE